VMVSILVGEQTLGLLGMVAAVPVVTVVKETARVMARAYGVEAATLACAFWMREAEISSMARVIFLVVWADLIFCR